MIVSLQRNVRTPAMAKPRNNGAVGRRHLWSPWLTLIIGAFALVVLACARAPHLVWKWSNSFDVKAIPTVPMPRGAFTEESVLVKVGSVELRIPEPLGHDARPVAGGLVGLHCDSDSKEVFVGLPYSNRETRRAFHKELADLPDRYRKSVPQLHVAIYQASSEDFSWSMSFDELQWHAWLIKKSRGIRVSSVSHVETLFGDEIEGILLVMQRSAVFEWYSKDGNAYGNVFFEEPMGEIDLKWVRPVCASLRFSGEVYPYEMTIEDLTKLVELPVSGE